uniref:Secreted protein n=1 Tax=Zea mays TaxID=4577 RepID=B7ZXP9_MAIZE|nr:unknown [Zea mays]
MSGLCNSIIFLIFFSCSICSKEDLLETRHWCWWLPEDLWWPPEEWLTPTSLLQEQWCHFTQHPPAAAGDGHH